MTLVENLDLETGGGAGARGKKGLGSGVLVCSLFFLSVLQLGNVNRDLSDEAN